MRKTKRVNNTTWKKCPRCDDDFPSKKAIMCIPCQSLEKAKKRRINKKK